MKTINEDLLTSKVKEKVRAFYDNFASNYDKNRYASKQQKFNDLMAKQVVFGMLGDCLGKSILDCGCGTGRFVEFFTKAGASVVGADVSDKMINIAREKTPTATFIKADVFSLPLNDKSFDVVTCSQVLTHLHNYEKPLLEMKRVLKDDGVIVIDVRNVLWPSRLPVIRSIFNFIDGKCKDYNPDYVSIMKIRNICNKIGLRVDNFIGTGFPRAEQCGVEKGIAMGRSILKYVAPTLILKIKKI